MHNYLDIKEEIQDAVSDKKPVVALESTIISHGMPYPENVQTALEVEQIIRDAGAIPATIAVMDGQLKAGLSQDEIEQLGQQGLSVTKASRRDLPFLLRNRQHGATTVAATMIVAAQAGIKVFATGGIGGVHRNGAQSFDISADLQELARTNVAVVCAGAKSILDLPLTLEYLETYGVPVIAYQTDEFPAFYTRESGLKAPYRLDDPSAIAECLKIKWKVELTGGIVIANPVPAAYSMDATHIAAVIDQAIVEADRQGINGKAVTPFLLSKIKNLSAGKSLVSNIELVRSNAQLAAQIAKAGIY
ncbi:MAG: pseudouridine-5'-phosphate glycosidase [Bacteroidota bacterium]